MSETINIYGTNITLPYYDGIIENWGTDNPSEQYWRKTEIPSFMKNIDFDKEGNAILNAEQRIYATEEVRRCKEGFWFLNNGVKTYITGRNYFYLKWWKLEDDIYPEYRDTDRRYFLYLDYWRNVHWCLGVIRGKKRREGATSQATSNLIYECIFFKNSICGLLSKTNTDGRTAFTNMVAFGYRQLPVFLKPKQLNNKDSVTELVFSNKSISVKGETGSIIDSDTGHRSKVDYRAPSVNAYDSGRLSYGLFDEGAKWDSEVPFSKFLSIVSKTMVKGAKRVGFMECPSTVNEMTKGGGAEFKSVWDKSDLTGREKTISRLVRYFSPSYDGYVGFIDRYGMSVIDAPNEEQYKYLCDTYLGAGDLTEADIKLGSKEYLLLKRKDLEGVDLEEEIRMNPFDEREMFMSAAIGCVFSNVMRMKAQLEWLTYHDVIERGNLEWENGDAFFYETSLNGEKEIKPSKLIWKPNKNGIYEKVIGWEPSEMNNVFIRNGQFKPNGYFATRIGADPFKYDKVKSERKSSLSSYVYQMPTAVKSEFDDMFVMRCAGRPVLTDTANEWVLRMAWYCGGQVLFERNVNHWKSYFSFLKCAGFLMWLPEEVEPGIYTDPKGNTVQNICDITEAYIDKHIERVYFKELIDEKTGWLGFEVGNTQQYDDAMAGGFTLVGTKIKRINTNQDNLRSISDYVRINKAV